VDEVVVRDRTWQHNEYADWYILLKLVGKIFQEGNKTPNKFLNMFCIYALSTIYQRFGLVLFVRTELHSGKGDPR
jgi:hypothetical protein